MINENSKIPFGRTHKGMKIRECPNSYLAWMSQKLWDTDFHEYAYIAKQILEGRKKENGGELIDPDMDADEFLRQHGVDPDDFR